MRDLGYHLSQNGWILRSGGADGADSAFEKFVDGRKRIFRPDDDYDFDKWDKAMEIAENHHPNWDRLGGYVKNLIVRNTFIILGKNLEIPSSFVVCWTPDGADTKEERSVESIADKYGIPVYNLKQDEHEKMFENLIKDLV